VTTGDVFGVLPDGREVARYRLGRTEGLRMSVLDLGCVVQELWVPDGAGQRVNVVLGAAEVDGYLQSAGDYFGAVVGRFANRIAHAEIVVDGTPYPLPANNGPHTLHGGPDGFHARLWQVEHADDTTIALSLVSPDGDQGFPGELRTRVVYEVSDEEVRIEYRAETDAPTVVNLTQHAHFNLSGEGSGSVEDHVLAVRASRYTPVGADLIPTGELAEVTGTPLDLREGRRIGEHLRSGAEQMRRGRGYDHNFVFDSAADSDDPAVVLSDPASGRVLEVRTDQPGVQVYTCNFLDGTHVGTSGRAYRQGDGVALETQHFPDSAHHEGELEWPRVLLRPGEVFSSWTSWRFPTR
jgi:aldose 1-epimerase